MSSTTMKSSCSKMALCLIALALAHAIPDYEQASNEVTTLLQQGKDQSACADLAKSLADEVSSNVDTANKNLAAIDDGSDCKDEAQGPLAQAQTAKEEADKAAGAAADAAAAAADAEVDFGTFSFASLNEDTCTQFWEDESYIAAKNAKEQADKASLEATATANAKETSLDEAKTAASHAKQSCLCGVRKTYNAAWAAATASKDEHAAAWAKAKNMECVLAGTAAAECQVGEVPAVSPKTLAADVPPEECAAEPTPPPTPTKKECSKCCKFKIYTKNNYKDAAGSYEFCRGPNDASSKKFKFNKQQRDGISSFKLTGSCVKVKLYDDDLELLQSGGVDNKVYTKSNNNLPNDLDNDTKEVRIYPKSC